MSNNFLISFEKKQRKRNIGLNVDIGNEQYHHIYQDTMNIDPTPSCSLRNTTMDFNPNVIMKNDRNEDAKTKPVYSSVSFKQSRANSNSHDHYNDSHYHKKLQSESNKGFNQSKVLHTKFPNSKYRLQKRPTKGQVANYFLCFENAKTEPNSFRETDSISSRYCNRITNEYEKLVSKRKAPSIANSIQSHSNLIQYPDDIESYKEYLRMVDSKELLKAKAKEILLTYQSQSKSPTIMTRKIKNNYLRNVLQKVVRSIEIYSKSNQEINENIVMNMLFEECDEVKFKIDWAMKAYCNIKNFSYAIMKDKEIVLLPLINSIRKLTKKEAKELTNKQSSFEVFNACNVKSGDFKLQTELGAINEQSSISISSFCNDGSKSQSKRKNDNEYVNNPPTIKKQSFWTVYNLKHNNRKVNLNPSTLPNDYVKWNTTTRISTMNDHPHGYSIFGSQINDGKNNHDESLSKRNYSKNTNSPNGNLRNETDKHTDNISTKRTEANTQEPELNQSKKGRDKQKRIESGHQHILISINNDGHKEININNRNILDISKQNIGEYQRDNDSKATIHKLSKEKKASKYNISNHGDNATIDGITIGNKKNVHFEHINNNEEAIQSLQHNNNQTQPKFVTESFEDLHTLSKELDDDRDHLKTQYKPNLNKKGLSRSQKNKKMAQRPKIKIKDKTKSKTKKGVSKDVEINQLSLINSETNNRDNDLINHNIQDNNNNDKHKKAKSNTNQLIIKEKESKPNEIRAKRSKIRNRSIKKKYQSKEGPTLNKRYIKDSDSNYGDNIEEENEDDLLLDIDKTKLKKGRIDEIQHKQRKSISMLLDKVTKYNHQNNINLSDFEGLKNITDEEIIELLKDNDFQKKIKEFREGLPITDTSITVSDVELVHNQLNKIIENNQIESIIKKEKQRRFSRPQKDLKSLLSLNNLGMLLNSKSINSEKGKKSFLFISNEDENHLKPSIPGRRKTIESLFNEIINPNEQGYELRATNNNLNNDSAGFLSLLMQSKLKAISLGNELEYQMSLQQSDEGKEKFRQLFNQIEHLRQEDVSSFMDSLNMSYKNLQEEITGKMKAKHKEDRLNRFLQSFDNYRQNQIGRRNVLNNQIRIRDNKFITSMSNFYPNSDRLGLNES